MGSFSIGATTTKVEVGKSFNGEVVEVLFAEAMFFNKNGKDIRSENFTGSFTADEVDENTSVSSTKVLASDEIVTGNEFRAGEIFSILDSDSVYVESAQVISSKPGFVTVTLFDSVKVLSGYTFIANPDLMLPATTKIRFDSRTYNNPTFATVASTPTVTNNLNVYRIDKNGNII